MIHTLPNWILSVKQSEIIHEAFFLAYDSGLAGRANPVRGWGIMGELSVTDRSAGETLGQRDFMGKQLLFHRDGETNFPRRSSGYWALDLYQRLGVPEADELRTHLTAAAHRP